MSPPRVRKSAHSQPLVAVVVALIVTSLTVTVFVTSSSQRDGRRKIRLNEELTGDDAEDRINEIDGFVLSVCGRFKRREWQDEQRAFNCKPTPAPMFSFDGTTTSRAEGAIDIKSARRDPVRDLSIQEFPFYAHLIIERADTSLECAGTLVDYEFVLTTARCAHAAQRILVVLGTSSIAATGGWSTKSDKWCYSNSYHPVDNPYPDLAVLRLKKDANYSAAIRPACIAQHMPLRKGAACMVARRRGNNLASQLQGFVVRERKCPAHLPELYEPNCYQAEEAEAGFCTLELGTPVVCYDTCDKNSSRLQAFVVGAESFAPTPGDTCDPERSTPIQYTDLTRKSRLIRTMTHTLINSTKYPTPSFMKCVEPCDSREKDCSAFAG